MSIFTILDVMPPAITWRTYLQDIYQIAQILGTVAVVIYVIYTYLTFRQIKRQTDYQQDAYLRVESSKLKTLPQLENQRGLSGVSAFRRPSTIDKSYIKHELPNKLTDALKKIFTLNDSLYEGDYFTLSFTNYGNAEVNKIKIKLKVVVRHSAEISEAKLLQEVIFENYQIDINKIIARNGGLIDIPLISTASFPFFEITASGSYFDIRDKEYSFSQTILTGENIHFHKLPSSPKETL